MSFLIIDHERFALQFGDTTLGGDADELFATSGLAALLPFAVLTTGVEEEATIRALPGGPPVLLGERILTPSLPSALHHGDRLLVGDVTIIYGDMRVAGRTAPVHGITEEVDVFGELSPSESTSPTGGRLIALPQGATYHIPQEGLTVGRDPECGILMNSKSVSRRHATIAPTLFGYTIVDESTNGVLVNGARIQGPTLLRQGDSVQVGTVAFRFEADAADFEPDTSLRPAVRPDTPRPIVVAPSLLELPLLATLEVLTRGVDEGRRFRIERPVVQLGRGPHNDVRIGDESISATHATLMRRGRTWHLIDLGSRNGSYVDGERVTEHRLDPVCEVRLGNVKLAFRALGAPTSDEQATRGIVGLGDGRVQ